MLAFHILFCKIEPLKNRLRGGPQKNQSEKKP